MLSRGAGRLTSAISQRTSRRLPSLGYFSLSVTRADYPINFTWAINAVTTQVKSGRFSMSGNATNQDLAEGCPQPVMAQLNKKSFKCCFLRCLNLKNAQSRRLFTGFPVTLDVSTFTVSFTLPSFGQTPCGSSSGRLGYQT